MVTDPTTGWIRGRVGYKSQMSSKEMADYIDKLNWIKAQKDLGKLTRGWQSKAAKEIGRSVMIVSHVMNMVHISPPILGELYAYAQRELGTALPVDIHAKVEMLKNLLDTIDEQLEAAKAQVALEEEQEATEYEQLEMKWIRQKALTQQKIADLEQKRYRAASNWEDAYVKQANEDEYLAYGTGYVEPEPEYVDPGAPPVITERAMEVFRELVLSTKAPVEEAYRAKQEAKRLAKEKFKEISPEG